MLCFSLVLLWRQLTSITESLWQRYLSLLSLASISTSPLAASFHTFIDLYIYSHYLISGAFSFWSSGVSPEVCVCMLIWTQNTSPQSQHAASFDNFDTTCINMSWHLLYSWQVWHFLRAKKRHSWNPASYYWLSAILSVLFSLVMQNQIACLQNLINCSTSHICNGLTWLQ